MSSITKLQETRRGSRRTTGCSYYSRRMPGPSPGTDRFPSCDDPSGNDPGQAGSITVTTIAVSTVQHLQRHVTTRLACKRFRLVTLAAGKLRVLRAYTRNPRRFGRVMGDRWCG
ncbi:hypothetical protein G7Z17_g4975 [Cylindrodendrum hubeiense]|uniref:Uncharacterized protein n=1 Tax=Cylindrodendrum hubeiense TaxID=595255 RepID=A0A9P5HBS6_9HYPO|nr:hypothetical protein G7Z17_g4975 [Cylindrodendrum hubeiense]